MSRKEDKFGELPMRRPAQLSREDAKKLADEIAVADEYVGGSPPGLHVVPVEPPASTPAAEVPAQPNIAPVEAQATEGSKEQAPKQPKKPRVKKPKLRSTAISRLPETKPGTKRNPRVLKTRPGVKTRVTTIHFEDSLLDRTHLGAAIHRLTLSQLVEEAVERWLDAEGIPQPGDLALRQKS